MKKLTPMARIIDIFQTEPTDTCQQLIEAAQQILKNRVGRNTTKPPRRRRSSSDSEQEHTS